MNIVCCICTEILNASADVFSTPCGHLFHNRCLHQWLERSKSCPQCRFAFAMRSIHKIYFNIGNTMETSFTEVGILQQTNDDLKLQINVKTKEVKELESKLALEVNLKHKLHAKYHVAQEKIRSSQFLVDTLREQLSLFELEVKRYNGIEDQLNKANAKLERVKLVEDILDSSVQQAEEIINGETNAKTLALLVATLKRELVSSETRRKELSSLFENLQSECKKKEDAKRTLKKHVDLLKTKIERLNTQIDQLKSISQNENDNNKPNIESSVSPENRKRISINRHSSDSLDFSPPGHEKIRKIEESASPYLHVKSSSVGLGPLVRRPIEAQGVGGPVKSKFGNIGIFKKPRLFTQSNKLVRSANERKWLNNGLGSSEQGSLI